MKPTEVQRLLAGQVRPPECRRTSVRVDDRLLLEYWPVADVPYSHGKLPRFSQVPLAGSPEAVEGLGLDPLMAQWMSKIEWTLDAILRTLEHQSPKRVIAPRLMEVNISGEAIRFIPDSPLAVGDLMDLRMVLPPFIPLEVRGEVSQTRPVSPLPEAAHAVVVRFMNMRDMDREKIIRYVVQRQADLIRRRDRDRRDPNLPVSP
jgi:hypothetical protein